MMVTKPATKSQVIRSIMKSHGKDTISMSSRKDGRDVRCYASFDDTRGDLDMITEIYTSAKRVGFSVQVVRKKNKGYIVPDTIIVKLSGSNTI